MTGEPVQLLLSPSSLTHFVSSPRVSSVEMVYESDVWYDCNYFHFMVGVIFYADPAGDGSDDALEEFSYAPVLRLIEKYDYDYELINKLAYNASIQRSPSDFVDGNHYPEDFNFCYDEVTNSYCKITSFLLQKGNSEINNYNHGLDSAACNDTFSVSDESW